MFVQLLSTARMIISLSFSVINKACMDVHATEEQYVFTSKQAHRTPLNKEGCAQRRYNSHELIDQLYKLKESM